MHPNKPTVLLLSLTVACVIVFAQDTPHLDQPLQGPLSALNAVARDDRPVEPPHGTQRLSDENQSSPRNRLNKNHDPFEADQVVAEQKGRHGHDGAVQSAVQVDRAKYRVYHHHHHATFKDNGKSSIHEENIHVAGLEDDSTGSLPLDATKKAQEQPQSPLQLSSDHLPFGGQQQTKQDQGADKEQLSGSSGPTKLDPSDSQHLIQEEVRGGSGRILEGNNDGDDEDDEDGEDDGDDEEDGEEEEQEETTSSPSTSPPAAVAMPTTRGFLPSVIGAHHCTPQFCVNASISDDGRVATFHIERDRDATGWISLGVGYAMTLADLLIFWPNPKAGPHGATFSRRTAQAYLEPRDTSAMDEDDAEHLPISEYFLHNTIEAQAPSSSSNNNNNAHTFDASKKFIVQFSRPLKIRRSEFNLTPGRSQDFCWAYSPTPIAADQVGDPAAHIQQHMSVGTFAMDVGAHQPQLKVVLAKLKEEEEKAKQDKKESATSGSEDNTPKHRHQHHGEDGRQPKTSAASAVSHRQSLGLVESSSLLILSTIFLAKILAAVL